MAKAFYFDLLPFQKCCWNPKARVLETEFLAILSFPTQTKLFLAFYNMKCFTCNPGKKEEKLVL